MLYIPLLLLFRWNTGDEYVTLYRSMHELFVTLKEKRKKHNQKHHSTVSGQKEHSSHCVDCADESKLKACHFGSLVTKYVDNLV